jgi:phosphatidylinositol kinase/protein kinase (PI-3  family)
VLPLTDDCGILQWVDNLVPFKAACEEVLAKEKLYSRHQTPHQIKKMYDGFVGEFTSRRFLLLDKVLPGLSPDLGKWLHLALANSVQLQTCNICHQHLSITASTSLLSPWLALQAATVRSC